MAHEIAPRDRLLAAQAFYKAVGKELKTGNPDNMRGRFDAELEGLYDMTGAKTFDLKIGDTKVGTASRTVRRSNAKPELSIVDMESFRAWVVDNMSAFYRAILDQCTKLGEIPDGCAPVYPEPTESVSWTLRGLDLKDVTEALRDTYGLAGTEIDHLIEGSTE